MLTSAVAIFPSPRPRPRQFHPLTRFCSVLQVNPSDFFSAETEGEAQYDVSHAVGKGSYGYVCAGRNRKTDEKVAIKHIDRVFSDKADTVRIIRELRFLRLLQHPNVVSVKNVLLPQKRKEFDDIYIVTELLDTDLSHLIKSKTTYEDVHVRWILFQLLNGLQHLHTANVYHRDLKPGNLLLNSNCDLKICDFGLARVDFKDSVSDGTPVFWTDYVATRWYRAPELICSYFTRYTAAVDLWAVGCIFAEIANRKPLFAGHNVYHQIDLITNMTGPPNAEAIKKIRNKKAQDHLRNLPPKVRPDWATLLPTLDATGLDLMEKLLAFDPEKRISAKRAVRHPYFAAFQGAIKNKTPAPPAPTMMREEFLWENEKNLTKAELRAVLYDEILHFHPGFNNEADVRYEPTAGTDVRSQMRAVGNGEEPIRASHSMPSATTAPLYEQARRDYERRTPSSSDSDSDSDAMVTTPNQTHSGNHTDGGHADPTDRSKDMCVEESPRAESWSSRTTADAVRRLAEKSASDLNAEEDESAFSRYQKLSATDRGHSVPIRAALKHWKKLKGAASGSSTDLAAVAGAGEDAALRLAEEAHTNANHQRQPNSGSSSSSEQISFENLHSTIVRQRKLVEASQDRSRTPPRRSNSPQRTHTPRPVQKKVPAAALDYSDTAAAMEAAAMDDPSQENCVLM